MLMLFWSMAAIMCMNLFNLILNFIDQCFFEGSFKPLDFLFLFRDKRHDPLSDAQFTRTSGQRRLNYAFVKSVRLQLTVKYFFRDKVFH